LHAQGPRLRVAAIPAFAVTRSRVYGAGEELTRWLFAVLFALKQRNRSDGHHCRYGVFVHEL
jgi:hypothetical protein